MLRNLLTVSFATLLSRLLGFVRDMLIAFVLGAGVIADAFIFAFRLPNLARRLYSEGALNAAFIPLFARIKTKRGEKKALIFSSHFFMLIMAFVVLLTAFLFLFVPFFLETLIGLKGEMLELTILLTRITLPFLIFSSLAALYAALLNANNRFTLVSFSHLILNILLIFVLLIMLFYNSISAKDMGVILGWAVSFSSLLQVILLIYATRRAGIRLYFTKFKLTAHLQKGFLLSLPALITSSITQINILVVTLLASAEQSVISWLYYADRLYQLPLGIVGVALGIVLLSDMTKEWQEGRIDDLRATHNFALELSLLLTLPASLGLYFGAELIVEVLFQRGAFSAVDTFETAKVIKALSLGLPFAVIIKVVSNIYFAKSELLKPFFIGLFIVVLNITLAYILFKTNKAFGLGLALSLSTFIYATILLVDLYRVKLFLPTSSFLTRVFKICVASVLMTTVLIVMPQSLSSYKILNLALYISSGIASFLLIIFITKAFPLELFKEISLKKDKGLQS